MHPTLIRDLAFWPSLGAIIGVGSYLAADANLPFWSTVAVNAALFTGFGMVVHVARRVR